MAVNKNFANYSNSKIPVRVLSGKEYPHLNYAPGPNRAFRRAEITRQKREAEFKRHSDIAYFKYQAKIAKRKRIEARHEENRQRSAARRALQKTKQSDE